MGYYQLWTRIWDYCQKTGIRASDLARMLSTDKQSVWRWTSGMTYPSTVMIELMLEKLGWTVEPPKKEKPDETTNHTRDAGR